MGCDHSSQHPSSSPLPPSQLHQQPRIYNFSSTPPIDNIQQLILLQDPSQQSSLSVQEKQKCYLDQSYKDQAAADNKPCPQPTLSLATKQPPALDAIRIISLLSDELQLHSVYSTLLDQQYLSSWLAKLSPAYLDNNHKESILYLLIQYAQSALNTLPRPEALDFVLTFARKAYHLGTSVISSNHNALKLLAFLDSQGKSFVDLKFDLSLKEMEEVVAVAKRLLRYSEKSFCYILLYLEISAFRLQDSLVSLVSIEDQLAECFKLLSASALPLTAPPQQISHPDYKLKDCPKIMMDLKGIASQERASYVQSFLQQLATKAQQQYESLRRLMEELVEKWGYVFQIVPYVHCDRSFIDSNRRIIDVQMQRLSIEKAVRDIEGLTLEDLYFLEKETYKEQLREIMAFVDGQIQFRPSKLLSCQCLFLHTHQISQCLPLLTTLAKQHNCTLSQISNRLNQTAGLSQVVAKIIINEIPVQVHLISSSDYKARTFNKSIAELSQNEAFSCFTRLRMISQSVLPRQLAEFKQLIRIHAKNKTTPNPSTLQQRFKELESLLPFQLLDQAKLEANLTVLSNAVNALSLIQQRRSALKDTIVTDSLARLRRIIQFKTIMKDLTSAEEEESAFYRSFQQNNLGTIQSALANEEPLSKENKELLVGYAEHQKKKGLRLMEDNVLDKAQKKFDKYIEIAKQLHSTLMLAEGKRCSGLLQHRKGNFKKALLIFQKCLETIKEEGIEQLPTLVSMGKVYAGQEKYQLALQAYGKCEQLIGESSQRQVENIQVYQLLGQIHCQEGRWQAARAYFQQCLELQQRKTGVDSIECIAYLVKLSQVLNGQADRSSSIQVLKKCLGIVQGIEQGDRVRQMEVRRLLSMRLIENGEYQQGLQLLRRNVKLLQGEEKSSLQYSECLKQMGEVHQCLGQYKESLQLYEQSLGMKQRINSKDEVAQLEVITKIAKAHQLLNNPAKSLLYQQKASSIEEKSKDKHSKDHLATFIRMGKKSLEKGNYPTSLKYLQKSIDILQQLKGRDCQESIPILRDMGSAYKQQGKHEEAIRCFSDSLTVVEKWKGKESIEAAESYHELGSIYEQTGSLQQSESYYLAALHLCQKYNIKYYIYAHSNFGLANIYFHRRLYSKAFQSYEKSFPILGKLTPQLYNQAIKQMDACDKHIEMQFGKEEGESEPE